MMQSVQEHIPPETIPITLGTFLPLPAATYVHNVLLRWTEQRLHIHHPAVRRRRIGSTASCRPNAIPATALFNPMHSSSSYESRSGTAHGYIIHAMISPVSLSFFITVVSTVLEKSHSKDADDAEPHRYGAAT